MGTQQNWAPEAAEKAAALWKSGLSASFIADELKVTRNAVIGKLHRMGLSKSRVRKKPVFRPKPKTFKAKFTTAPEDESLAANPDRLHPFDAAIPKKQRRQTWELTSKTCRWPIGIPGHRDFGHCGGKTLDGYVYCRNHCERAFVPTQAICEAGIIA
jgi:GcrA cell cycle regulator